MPVVSTTPDTENLTLTIVSQHTAPVDRVWQVWADPRLLERWWGPPTWPATFTEHDLRPGGRAAYYMTGPEGERAGGWWQFTAVDAPRSLEFEDGFATADGSPDPTMPVVAARVDLAEHDGGTRMTIVSTFATAGQMDQLTTMGMAEGMSLALGQVDDLLVTV